MPFNLDFVPEIVENFSLWSSLGSLAALHLGPKYMNWQFFHKIDPILIWILHRKLNKKTEMGSFGAEW